MKLRLAILACLATLASPAALAADADEGMNLRPGSELAEATSEAETETEITQEEIVDKIKELEIQLIKLKKAAGVYGEGKKIALPKNGIYVQSDIGVQQREWAGENGNTQLFFDAGLYGGLAVGYRYDRNWRFAFEYTEMNNDVSDMRSGAPVKEFRDPKSDVLLQVGSEKEPGSGDVKLQSYTLNAYYDLNGFGHERRFRPYVGAGVGLQTSTLKGVQPASFPFIGFGAEANKASTDPVITLEAGLSYLATDQAEFFIGGEYSFVDNFLLENTDFGNLQPQGSRNWILKTGARYTF